MKQTYVFNNIEEPKSYNVIKKASKACDRIYIAVAFLSDIELLKEWVKDNKQINLIVALEYPTNPKSLRYLLPLPQVQLKFNSTLHAKKIIFFKSNTPVAAIVGSSNFTQGGLFNNIETNVFLDQNIYLTELTAQFNKMWAMSQNLQPDDLENYEKHYAKIIRPSQFLQGQHEHYKKNIIRRSRREQFSNPCKEARDYNKFWDQVDEICNLVRGLSAKEWPEVPIYLTIDHFWHYIKVEWDRSGLRKIQKDPEWQKKQIPYLFEKYITWNNSTGNYTSSMKGISEQLAHLLSKERISHLSKKDAEYIYTKLHSGGMRSTRFAGNKKFVKDNDIFKIRKSLDYLLWSDDDIEVKIDRLIRDPKYKLEQFGSSNIQEIIGWVQPEKMPLRNNKADDAVELLGYNFR